MNNTDAFVRDVGLLVAAKRCSECLFTKHKIVSDARRDAVLKDCRDSGKYFLCHQSTLAHRAVVCRGFFDAEPNQACQVADRLGLVVFVNPETGATP